MVCLSTVRLTSRFNNEKSSHHRVPHTGLEHSKQCFFRVLECNAGVLTAASSPVCMLYDFYINIVTFENQ